MMLTSKTYQALVAIPSETEIQLKQETRNIRPLRQGEVGIQVHYSSLNFKDALAVKKDSKVVQSYPIVPGIDLAGTVTDSHDPRFQTGDNVLITGYGLGVSQDGGFSEWACVPGDWVIPLPEGLTLEDAMFFGTAGFTAALCIQHLEQNGLRPNNGPVLVTGASGGVGSIAVAMLAKLGYEVTAATGKAKEHAFLRNLGAAHIVSREQVTTKDSKPLLKGIWAGAVDPVGGNTLSYILSTLKYGGAVANCGLTAGVNVHTTVYPFILRGVGLLGIDSVNCPMETRKVVWKRIADELKLPEPLKEQMIDRIHLEEIPHRLNDLLKGKARGRIVVELNRS